MIIFPQFKNHDLCDTSPVNSFRPVLLPWHGIIENSKKQAKVTTDIHGKFLKTIACKLMQTRQWIKLFINCKTFRCCKLL